MPFQKQKKSNRFSVLLNRVQNKRKNRRNHVRCSVSKENLDPRWQDERRKKSKRNESRKPDKRSSESKRHLNADGSSFLQLNEICNKVISARASCPFPYQEKEESSFTKTSKPDCATVSQQTLKSEGSSGRQLQLILEKLMLEENKDKEIQILPQQNEMYKKEIQFGTPTLATSPTRNTPIETPPQTETHVAPNSQKRFRFEMVDTNEQAKLYLRERKRKKKKKPKKRLDRNRERLMRNCDIPPGLELKSNSVISMSSCSIDSILEDDLETQYRNKKSKNYSQSKENNFEGISCNASQVAYDIKNAFENSWWFGNCFSTNQEN